MVKPFAAAKTRNARHWPPPSIPKSARALLQIPKPVRPITNHKTCRMLQLRYSKLCCVLAVKSSKSKEMARPCTNDALNLLGQLRQRASSEQSMDIDMHGLRAQRPPLLGPSIGSRAAAAAPRLSKASAARRGPGVHWHRMTLSRSIFTMGHLCSFDCASHDSMIGIDRGKKTAEKADADICLALPPAAGDPKPSRVSSAKEYDQRQRLCTER